MRFVFNNSTLLPCKNALISTEYPVEICATYRMEVGA